MIPLSELRKAHKKREDEQTAVACDAADDEICTAEDPSKCRVHGIRRYEREGDYLDKLAHASEESEEARKKFNYFRDLANSMTMEEAEKEIASVFCLSASKREELADTRPSPKQKVLIASALNEFAETVDAKTVAKTKKTVAATLRYLREKYDTLTFPKDISLLLMRTKDHTKAGATIVNEDKDAMCVIFSCVPPSRNTHSFCHGDYRDDFDYLRHELGHVIAISHGIGDTDFMGSLSLDEESARKVLLSVSKYAYEKRMEGEAEAECFSCYTADDYDGRLPKEIEKFINDRMIGGGK